MLSFLFLISLTILFVMLGTYKLYMLLLIGLSFHHFYIIEFIRYQAN
jgi:hypothetical protein